MQIFNSFEDLAETLGVKVEKIKEKYNKKWSNGFFIGDRCINTYEKDDELIFIIVNRNNKQDCKEYFLKYEKDYYDWEVYTDDLVGWEKCSVIDIVNTKNEIKRATVITESGYQLDRVCKVIDDKEDDDYKPDGCIYYWENDF